MRDFYKKQFFVVALVAILFIVIIVATTIRDQASDTVVSEEEVLLLPNTLAVGDNHFEIELATDYDERSRGLSGRASLPENQGMLFLFNEAGSYGFWMKNMHFPIDIIWIRGNTIVGIHENLAPEGEQPTNTYYPPEPADKVFEINAGLARELEISVGDMVELLYEE